jgi:nitrogen fixation NifU-like protein
MHNPTLMDHFQHPRNVGELAHATAKAMVENPGCGDILLLSVRLEEGRVAEARFKAKGCVAAMAAGSALTELVTGKTVAELAALGVADVDAALGGLIPESKHVARLCVDTVRKLLQSVR